MTQYLYLLIDLCCIAGPFILSFHPKLNFYKNFRAVFIGILSMMLLFILWDSYFTANDIWHFSDVYTLPARLLLLPIEEWLFFICIPFACLFTYEVIVYYFPKGLSKIVSNAIAIILILICLTICLVYHSHWYTFYATLGSALLISYHLIRQTSYLGHFFISYSLLQIPFFISNGILTGLKFWNYSIINTQNIEIADAVVYYNNNHNLQIRIWSVPLDDFFYGMTMILLSLTIYQWAKDYFSPNSANNAS
ncbi:MAG: lycopene cyclase domain-containing protein [Bacteroidota bacterium]